MYNDNLLNELFMFVYANTYTYAYSDNCSKRGAIRKLTLVVGMMYAACVNSSPLQKKK